MIRATIDTSVFVSALNFGGIPEQILELLEAAAFTLCLSQSIAEEVRRVLKATPFEWTAGDLAEVLDPILSLAEVVEPSRLVIASRDPDDDHILACALEAKADFIVSGDKDLLVLGRFEGTRIVSPRAFWEILKRQEA